MPDWSAAGPAILAAFLASSVEVVWAGKGLGVEWPRENAAHLVFGGVFLVAGPLAARMVWEDAR